MLAYVYFFSTIVQRSDLGIVWYIVYIDYKMVFATDTFYVILFLVIDINMVSVRWKVLLKKRKL